mgnify:CR=1 FL=1
MLLRREEQQVMVPTQAPAAAHPAAVVGQQGSAAGAGAAVAVRGLLDFLTHASMSHGSAYFLLVVKHQLQPAHSDATVASLELVAVRSP